MRTREPGGTPKAEAVRAFILQGRSEAWGPGAEAVLFAAARLDHVNQLIAPNLDAGRWVISDRFSDSTRAYQGLTGGVDVRLIDALEVLALNGHKPDLTIVLDMDPEAAFRRVLERETEAVLADTGDRFEKEDLEWHKRLRDAFLAIARNNAERCVVIPANQNEENLAQEIWDVHDPPLPRTAVRADGVSDDEVREPDQLEGVPLPETRTRVVGHDAARANIMAALDADRGCPAASCCTARAASARRRWPSTSPAKCSPAPATRAAEHIAAQVAAGAYPNLRVLRKAPRDTGKGFYTAIRVEEVRGLIEESRMTRGRAGFRIVIVDSIDDCNPSSANALLKILEEPPAETLFLLVSHRPGGLLPTIKSRCHAVALRPLTRRRCPRDRAGA